MARPIKPRIVCSEPRFNEFGSITNKEIDYIFMTLEEYETIRLIDYNDLTQEEASEFMHVARTTVQNIYENARKKIANAIINGKSIKIQGGNYNLCTKMSLGKNCNKRNCKRFNREIY